MRTYFFALFLVVLTMGMWSVVYGQILEPVGYFSGTIYVHGTQDPIPGSMQILLRHCAQADVYVYSGGEWRLEWQSGYWIEETVTASPDYEYQISLDAYNTEFPQAHEGAIHVHYSYGDSSETILYNQGGWCVVGPHIQGNGPNMEGLEWYVMEKIYDQNDNNILDVFERPLIEKFCPSIVLHSEDQGVSPEPVRIMAPDHAKYLWVRAHNILGEAIERQICEYWDPPVGEYYAWLETRNYSFINGEEYKYIGAPPGAAVQPYYLLFHFEWAGQGNTPSEWRAAYGSEAANNDFEDTIYAHLFFLGTTYLIQYWFFYPFNDFINNHEGDWEHINVIVNSQNPDEAHVVRVDYYFHHNVLSVSDPGVDFFLEDDSHPIVFVGGSGSISVGSGDGSHGSFPVNGTWRECGGGCCWFTDKPDETVDGEGRYIRYDGIRVVNVPEPEEINYLIHPEWSWLKANVPWGHVNVDSPADWWEEFSWLSFFFGECCFPDDIGNVAPCGPAYNGSWNRIGQVDGWYDGYASGAPYAPVTRTDWVPPYPTRGDFSGDGKVDIVDVKGVIDIILGLMDPSPYQFWAANMEADEQINVLDVLAIVNSILGVPAFSDSLVYSSCTLELFQKTENEYEVRLDNSLGVSAVELHLPSTPVFRSLRTTGRSSSLDSAYTADSDKVVIVLYSATGDSIEAGSGSVLDLSFSEEEQPCITSAILAAPDGGKLPVVLRMPPHAVDLHPVQDVYISAHSAYQTYNYGQKNVISTGRNSKYPGYIHRSLLEFDLSAVPSAAVVDEASLHLFIVSNTRCNRTTELNVFRMEHHWVEGTGNHYPTGDGATWLTSDGSTDWLGGGGAAGPGDCEQTVIGAVTIPYIADIGQEITIPLDGAAVEEMLDGGSFGNYGFLIKDTDEYQDAYVYHSSESSDSPSRPRLEIIYRGCGGSPASVQHPPSITIVNPPSGGAQVDGSYTITWTSEDPDGDVCTVDLYYDSNTSSGGQIQIVTNTTDDGDFTWNTSAISDGNYYIYGVIDDGNGGTDSDYSAGRVTVVHAGGDPPCDQPQILSMSPNAGDEGSAVWISGDDFGDMQGQSDVIFFPNRTASISIWSDAQIKCAVPVGAESGNMTVTTDCGASNGVHFTVTTSEPGCPYVSPWTGDEYAVGNNILAASEDTNRAELNVVDYFRLEQPCVEKDGRYRLQIREFEQEHTYLDKIGLKTVDHPKGQHLGVTDEGECFLYRREVLPISCVDSAEVDRLGLINTIGDGDYEGFPTEWLTVDFGHIGNPQNMYVEIVADLLPDPPKDQTIVLQLRGEHEWDWHDIALLHPRQHWATHLVDLSPWIDDGPQDIAIRLYWLARHKVDYICLAKSTPGPLVEQVCVFESAVHSVAGEVTEGLLTADNQYAEITPGQEIEVTLVPSPCTRGFKRDFIVVATGYYVKEVPRAPAKMSLMEDHAIPWQYGLSQNCPNPFNITTDIGYQIVDHGSPIHVVLTIFNLTGQAVRTLVDEAKSPGYHVVAWDGRDARGREVSSGVYFCRLSAGGFVAIRRMVLMK